MNCGRFRYVVIRNAIQAITDKFKQIVLDLNVH